MTNFQSSFKVKCQKLVIGNWEFVILGDLYDSSARGDSAKCAGVRDIFPEARHIFQWLAWYTPNRSGKKHNSDF